MDNDSEETWIMSIEIQINPKPDKQNRLTHNAIAILRVIWSKNRRDS